MTGHKMVEKFSNPRLTAKGEERAWVDLTELRTLWFNTGSLCNLNCANCYMESSPTNDRLAYIGLDDAVSYLNEIAEHKLPTEEIGLTGGEPFLNPDIVRIMEEVLERGFGLLVLTNATKPMAKHKQQLLDLNKRFGKKLVIRVSVDHYERKQYEQNRGPHTWEHMVKGLGWLCENGFSINIAGRTLWDASEERLRQGYSDFFAKHNMQIDAFDSTQLVLFPEMDAKAPVPEITTACWGILSKHPNQMMCATSRMIVKHKGNGTNVMACTLLPYDSRFNLGPNLKSATKQVFLNHPHCARFCVLGGGACS